ncbi:hypothetical protein BGX34_007140 [Mortierella sp. NVP85]|nr:hypothetical protein BGX34_007140 [Mortierella sp. NVP85]
MTLSVLSQVSASITCALPAGGTYKAGDSIILDWGSDGTQPVVSEITSINGTLYCNANNLKIADVSIPNLTGPFNWTVPDVGNATTIGGTVGTCAQNAFHIEYSGEASGFLGITKIPWGPVRCGTITISPAPNGTLTTTTTAMSSTSRTSAAPTATETSADSEGGGLSTTVVAIVAVVATLVVTLSAVALVVCLRKRRRQRKLDKVLMPWNAGSVNRFSKVSTTEDGSTSPRPSGVDEGVGMSSVTGAGAGVGAGITQAYEVKPQPAVPQPNPYYPDDGDYNSYAYHHQQQQQLLGQQQGYNQQGYENYNEEDAYYNPYYASGAGLDGGIMNRSNPSFYSTNHPDVSGSNQVRSSYTQNPYQGGDLSQHHISGYFPPPPPNSSSHPSLVSYTRAPAFSRTELANSGAEPSAPALTSLPTNSSVTSSPKRAPQTVMQEMGSKETEEDSASYKVPLDGTM